MVVPDRGESEPDLTHLTFRSGSGCCCAHPLLFLTRITPETRTFTVRSGGFLEMGEWRFLGGNRCSRLLLAV